MPHGVFRSNCSPPSFPLRAYPNHEAIGGILCQSTIHAQAYVNQWSAKKVNLADKTSLGFRKEEVLITPVKPCHPTKTFFVSFLSCLTSTHALRAVTSCKPASYICDWRISHPSMGDVTPRNPSIIGVAKRATFYSRSHRTRISRSNAKCKVERGHKQSPTIPKAPACKALL